MRFVIHADALNVSESGLRLLDRIVDRVEDEVHRLDLADPDALGGSAWAGEARPARRALVRKACATPPRARARHGVHRIHVDVTCDDDLLAAEKRAHMPLCILVENQAADGALLTMAVEELASAEVRLLWASKCVPPAISVVHAGGVGSVPTALRSILEHAATLGVPARVFVVFDSDRRWPGDLGTDKQAEQAVEACCSAGVPFHMLWKRTAECYVPDEVLEAWHAVAPSPRKRKQLDRVRKLSGTQRDHLSKEYSLSPQDRAGAAAAGLYAADEADLGLLEAAMVVPKRDDQHGTQLIPRLIRDHRTAFNSVSLRARDGAGELESLLSAIADEL